MRFCGRMRLIMLVYNRTRSRSPLSLHPMVMCRGRSSVHPKPTQCPIAFDGLPPVLVWPVPWLATVTSCE